MAGNILKTAKVITKTAEKITLNANNGDIVFNAAKSVKYSAKKDIVYDSYVAPEAEQTENLLVTKVICDVTEVEIGKTYTFKAVQFSRKPEAGGKELEQVKWAYKIDDGDIQYFKNKGTVKGNTVIKKVKIPESLWDNKTLRIYAYMQNATDDVRVECEIDTVSLPFYIDRYKQKGKKSELKIADDICYGNGVNLNTGHSIYSTEDVKDLGFLFNIQIGQSNEILWNVFSSMVTSVFSVGELEKVALKMILNFKNNTGSEFSDPILTEHAKNHDSTKRFCNSIEKLITTKLKSSKGNLKHLEDETIDWSGKPYGHPRFNTYKDTFAGGLTICMNDTWAYEILVTDYKLSGNNYELTYEIILYDHFGLDKPDMEKKYSWGAGFRAWFVLQHLRNYKPFITKVEFKKTINGTYSD